MFPTRKSFLSAVVLVLLLGGTGPSWSQTGYPARPIRMVVALGPGSGTDSLARFLAEPLRRELGAEFIVENRAGAGGVIGGDYLAKAKPDGYTLALFHASVVSTAPVVNANVKYDPIRDFTPVATLVTNQLALIVGAGSRWQSLEQLIAEARQSPGKIACGIIGVGSHTHINLELLKMASGADLNRIPYAEGTGPIVAGMMGGHLDCASLVWPAISKIVQSGKFRALAVTSPVKGFAQIPTFASKGYPQASLEVFFAVFGPAGLPPEVMARLTPAYERVMHNAEVVDRLENMGFSILYENSVQLGERLKRELAAVKEVAEKAGIKGE